jgi:hypothetical protein
MSEERLATVKGTLERETENALQIRQDKVLTWIPKSQVKYKRIDPSVGISNERRITLNVPMWLARQKAREFPAFDFE